MSRLLAKLGAGLAYFAIATLLAQVALVALGVSHGRLTESSLRKIRDVLNGVDTSDGVVGAGIAQEIELPSYEEILAARSVQFRTLELREEIVRQNVNLVNRERLEFSQQRDAFERARQTFEEQLAQMQDAALLAGEENVRETVATMKPQQAKQQIMLMLEQGEMEKVVALLAAMPMNKRAKIVAEFQTPEDATRLHEILEKMGQGEPTTQYIEQARDATPPTLNR